MTTKNNKIIREQLDQTLKRFKGLQAMSRPAKGWLRAVRQALGMSGRQFAQRMGVSPARVTKLESDEMAGAVSIKTLQRAAAALDCTLVYGLVPRTSLEDTVSKQVDLYSRQRLSRISHTMALEDQELSEKGKKKALKALKEDMLRNLPKTLWDK